MRMRVFFLVAALAAGSVAWAEVRVGEVRSTQAKAGVAKIEDTPNAEMEAPVRSAIRRCEVVMNVSPVSYAAAADFWLRLENPSWMAARSAHNAARPQGETFL